MTKYQEQKAARDAAKKSAFRDCRATCVELERQFGAAHEAKREALFAAELAFAHATLEVSMSCATEVREVIYPLAELFADSPRSISAQMGEAWRDINTRCLNATGEGVCDRHLTMTFLHAAGRLHCASTDQFWESGLGSAASVAAREMAAGASAARIEELLRPVEIAAHEHNKHREWADNPGRLAIVQAFALRGHRAEALTLFKEQAGTPAEIAERLAAKMAHQAASVAYDPRTIAELGRQKQERLQDLKDLGIRSQQA